MGHAIGEMREGESYDGVLWLVTGQVRQTKNGDPYWEGTFQDATGSLSGKLWDSGGGKRGRVKAFAEALVPGRAVQVQAVVDAFQGTLQLNLSSVRPAAAGEYDPSWFSPRSRRAPEEMASAFAALAASVKDPHWGALLGAFQADESLFRGFCEAPAAKSIHHAWVGGLLEHTLSLARGADALLPGYPLLDRDLVVCACVFHDAGKVFEISSDPGFEYTTDGKLHGHIYMGARLVERLCDALPGFPGEKRRHLVHLVLSHQGERSEGFGSAADPSTPEALFFHHLDNLDAKVQNALTALERADAAGETAPFTSGRGFPRKSFYRVRPGAEGVPAAPPPVEPPVRPEEEGENGSPQPKLW